jgi:hypothetical protein
VGQRRRGKKARAVKPPVETVIVDVIEEPVPGVAVVTEFEAREVHEEPEESRSVPPEPEEQ